jgi:recyclin-1
MSNVNREAEKRDFLTTFKKVILTPISVIPSAFTTSKQPTVPEPVKPTTEKTPYALDEDPSRLSVTSAGSDERNGMNFSVVSGRASPIPALPPTTELAAKAAIMNSRLEGIRSLFSLEVALNLVHMARESLERAAIFTGVGGQTGEEAYVPHCVLYPTVSNLCLAANNARLYS